MILNLDQNFKPYPERKSIRFKSFTFSGGEPHIKILDKPESHEEVTITQRIGSFNDFGFLLIAIDALKRIGIEKINVFIPYFPAARQDRLMVEGEALSVKVYTNILNNLRLNSITILDPHSDVTPALLNNCNTINNHKFIRKVIQKLPNNIKLISPDGGSLKKIYKLAEQLQNYEVIECSKVRDVKTGKLSHFNVHSTDLKRQDCLIIDDICDGGGTFLGLAKELKNKNAGNLYLAVSHGIFSKGTDELKKSFTQIFTTDSIKNTGNTDNIYKLKISDIL
ncbi:ribose-phosphate diphosphokinase [Leptobacterium flavescens]|uniref:Ribose-phosphate diphosphokinase n=1 Tax=Leptobacterium flavescens TaxID=472055 RepID=A0A6P0UNC6_9FLAO|nr:ribose-phosphate diphosphokinase [Leptobacterium flavescens]NER14675.1 ribose-phosphate diphosphokinase [Leptobacterium flavescens]